MEDPNIGLGPLTLFLWTVACWSLYVVIVGKIRIRFNIIKICFWVLLTAWMLGGMKILVDWGEAFSGQTEISGGNKAILFLTIVFVCWLCPPWLVLGVLKIFFPKLWKRFANNTRGAKRLISSL